MLSESKQPNKRMDTNHRQALHSGPTVFFRRWIRGHRPFPAAVSDPVPSQSVSQ